jgi:hypothetical protein
MCTLHEYCGVEGSQLLTPADKLAVGNIDGVPQLPLQCQARHVVRDPRLLLTAGERKKIKNG